MTISHAAIVRLNNDVNVGFNDRVVVITLRDSRLSYPAHALKVLEVFSQWTRIDDGIKNLGARSGDKAEFMSLSAIFHALLKHNFFKFKDDTPKQFALHSSHFDAFPVHLRMLNDTARTLAFQQAIRATLTHDDIVLDIGTGNGILAATAALAGAKHVYAVERTGFIEVARAVFKANGVSDRITLLNEDSTNISLPEPATVLVSEIIGNDPFQEGILRTFSDAKQRLLTADARIIPQDLKVFALALHCPDEKHQRHRLTPATVERWRQSYGIDFSAFFEFYDSKELSRTLQPSQIMKDWTHLSAPIELSHQVFQGMPPEQNRIEDGERTLTINTAGELNAILLFFETTLAEGKTLSMHPQLVDPNNHWQSLLFLSDPTTVAEGEQFDLHYRVENMKSQLKLSRR